MNHDQSGGFAHIVGLGLERQAPHGNGLTFQVFALEGFLQFLKEDALLALIHTLNSLKHFHGIAVLVGSLDQGLDVFGETAATIATACIQELTTDTGVGTNSRAYHINISPYPFAKVGNIVHERDTGGQHRVSGIFGHLSRGDVHENHTEIVNQEGLVQLGQHLLGMFALHTHHDTVGRHEVLDGITFLQELRIGGYVKLQVLQSTFGQLLFNGFAHLGSGTYGNGRLGDHYQIMVHVLTNGTSHLQHIFQVGRAILIRRSTYRREHNLHIVEH